MIPDIQAVLSGERRWCVVTGDSLAILPTLPDRAVDHVICDPPYDDRTSAGARTGKGSTRTRGGGSLRGSAFITFGGIVPAEVGPRIVRVVRRWAIAFCALEQIGEYKAASPDRWVRAGYWDKPDGAPQFTGDRPAQGGEGIAILHGVGKKRWNAGGKRGVWTCNRERTPNGHPTPKPVGLMVELIRDFTDVGDVILDPFAGSGTTLVAALYTGRRCIGIELNPKHAALSRERAAAAESGLMLNAARAGQISLFGAAQ